MIVNSAYLAMQTADLLDKQPQHPELLETLLCYK